MVKEPINVLLFTLNVSIINYNKTLSGLLVVSMNLNYESFITVESKLSERKRHNTRRDRQSDEQKHLRSLILPKDPKSKTFDVRLTL